MVKIAVTCLILVVGLACNDDEGGGGTCVDLAENPSFVFDSDPNCPTDGLQQVCNRYICITRQGHLAGIVSPGRCEAQSCVTMTCDRVTQDGSTFRGGFTVARVFEGNKFQGALTVRDSVVNDVTCLPIIDGPCIPNADLVDSACVAEDLLNVCVPFGLCGVTIDTPDGPIHGDFIVPICEKHFATDCETLNCDGEPFVTDLMVTGRDSPTLSGSIFVNGEPIPFFPCGLF